MSSGSKTKALLMVAGMMGMFEESPLMRMERQNQEYKKRQWHKIGSKYSHCGNLCDPQEVFCSDECRNGYKRD